MASQKVSYNAMKSNIDDTQLSQAFEDTPATKSSIKMMSIDDIVLDPKGEFNNLFPIDNDDIQNITTSMEERGYDKSKALDLAIIEEESETFDKPILIEGHTRLIAARNAGIDEVPVYVHTYETRKEAMVAAILYQINRRNLTSGDKVKAFALLDTIKNRGHKKDGETAEGKSIVGLSEQLGISPRTGEKIRNILQNGDEETKNALMNDEISINKAYNLTHEKQEDDETVNYISFVLVLLVFF